MERKYAQEATDKAIELLAIDSPTGFTAKASEWVKNAFSELGYSAEITKKGGVLVDLGGKVLNVAVEHDVYGQIVMDLIIATRKDVDDFCLRLASSKSGPLLSVADGTHIHTVEADSDVILDKISAALAEKSYLRK